jgi:hypothetical protein
MDVRFDCISVVVHSLFVPALAAVLVILSHARIHFTFILENVTQVSMSDTGVWALKTDHTIWYRSNTYMHCPPISDTLWIDIKDGKTATFFFFLFLFFLFLFFLLLLRILV